MSTGNEIIDLQSPSHSSSSKGEEQGRDGWTGTFDTNRPSLQAALHGLGYGATARASRDGGEEIVDYGIVPDTYVPTPVLRPLPFLQVDSSTHPLPIH